MRLPCISWVNSDSVFILAIQPRQFNHLTRIETDVEAPVALRKKRFAALPIHIFAEGAVYISVTLVNSEYSSLISC